MKKKYVVFSIFLSLAGLMAFQTGGSMDPLNASGGPVGYAGDPSGGNKTCGSGGGCHTGAPVGNLSGVITSNIPGTGYTAGNTYTITAAFVRPGHNRFGFQISPQNPTGGLLGSMTILSSQTKLVGASKYITQTSTGSSGSGSKTWSFQWTAPATGLGPVTFYGAFNAADNNGQSDGDSIFRSTLVVNEAGNGVFENRMDVQLNLYPNPAAERIIAEFTLEHSDEAELSILGIRGERVLPSISSRFAAGDQVQEFNIAELPPGIYWLHIRTGNQYAARKFIKL